MAILANGGAKIAAHENTDSENDQGDGEEIQRITNNIEQFKIVFRIDSSYLY